MLGNGLRNRSLADCFSNNAVSKAFMKSLTDYVTEVVSPRQFYSEQFPGVIFPGGGTEPRVMCCFHQDKNTPSLHFNPETGAFYCHGCEASGNSIVSFVVLHEEISRQEAAEKLYHKFVHPTISEKLVLKWQKALIDTSSALKYLTGPKRLINLETIKKYKIGWTGTRFTIPIYDEFKLCVNTKMYDPLSKKHGTYKMVNYKIDSEPRSFGTPVMIYPMPVFELANQLGYIVVCEGEWDALFLLSMDIPAVTSSGGSKSWPAQYNELFRGLRVIIAYDNDADGTLYDRKVVLKNLKKVAKKIKRLDIPKLVRGHRTKDVTEWGENALWMREKKAWMAEFKKAPVLLENSEELIQTPTMDTVPLDQASQAEHYNKRIRVEAIITGKDTAPYMLPKEYRIRCARDCDDCPLGDAKKDYKEVEIDPTDPRTLGMIDSSQQQLKRTLLTIGGFADCKPTCHAEIEVTKAYTLEQLLLIPTLDSKTSQYVMRSCYNIGHGLHSNRAYSFEGVTVPHPEDQHATHLFNAAKPVQDEIETFTLTPEVKKRLEVFRPKKLNLLAHLMNIAEWQSRNITKIRERPDLHVAVDLVFHSVAAFEFNNEYQNRGMLDVLILGDTRCGKGYVTEGLTRYYGLGELASGENCTFAGLVGGLQQVGKRWLVTWGLIPLNHRRLVTIDEASSLSTDEIGKMSRVRSEGVAEISKIVRESTQANTRLIWLSNPRSGLPIMTENAGVEAIKKLVGANEDIARFDFAMTVATNEVPSEIINAQADYSTEDSDLYPRELCRSLILWAWSRRPDQIKFSSEAVTEIIRQAINFGHTYSPTIPLVQAENIRVKIAKIAAAVAARAFSADETGEILRVEKVHVECACKFLNIIYSKGSMAYDAYSRNSQSGGRMESSQSPIVKIFDSLGQDKHPTISGLLQLHRITPDTLGDYVGDKGAAKSLIGDLVRARCLTLMEAGNWYLKHPDFSSWLRSNKESPINGVHKVNGTKRGKTNADQ